MTMMKDNHPLLQLVLNDSGRLAMPVYDRDHQYCPTCLKKVRSNEDGSLTHLGDVNHKPCRPSVSVVVAKAIIELLSDGEKIYVNPIRNRGKTLAPSVIFSPETPTFKAFINSDYQPVGANWKSDKGYKLGLFYLKDWTSTVNKEEFDFIAVIDPQVMLKEFNLAWPSGCAVTPLETLKQYLRSKNISSVWVKWPEKIDLAKKGIGTDNFWYFYQHDYQASACSASVIGIEGNSSGETIYRLQTLLKRKLNEYQLVRSLGTVMLLDNTGNMISPNDPNFEIISRACINEVKDFVLQNPWIVSHRNSSSQY
nr:hypothetical protein VW1E2_00046 [Enterobacter sp.]